MNLYLTQIDEPDGQTLLPVAGRGWTWVHLPFRRVVAQKNTAAEADLSSEDWAAIVITSKQAARWLRDHGFGPGSRPLAVVGKATAALLPRERLLWADRFPANSAELAAALDAHFPRPARFLFLHGNETGSALSDALAHHRLVSRQVYRTELIARTFPREAPLGMVYFQAPTAVQDFARVYGEPPRAIAVIGPSTRRAVLAMGWQPDFQPGRPELPHFAEELPEPGYFSQFKVGR